MVRRIFTYAPSAFIPAFVSFVILYAYTRLLDPATFGIFTLGFSCVLFVVNAIFLSIPITSARFFNEYKNQGRTSVFLAQCYSLLFLLACVTAFCALILIFFIPKHDCTILACVVGLILVRSIVALAQSIRRISQPALEYNVIECLHAILGFAFGLLLIVVEGPSAEALLTALLAAAIVCAVPSVRELALPFIYRTELRGPSMARLMRFAGSVIAVDTVIMTLQLSDRFLLAGLSGPAAVGIYAVAYSLVDRPMALLCNAIGTMTFPMALQALRSGRHACAHQLGRNGALLLAFGVPATIGLALTSRNLADELIGPAFRSGVVAIIPIMCCSALLRGLSTQFIDHAFYLAERPSRSQSVYSAAAAANVTLNLVLIPKYGAAGAAYAGLIGHIVALAFGWFRARTIFPVWLPRTDVMKVALAASAMAFVLAIEEFPRTWMGLINGVTAGALVFGAAALLLNTCGSRVAMLRLLQAKRIAIR